MAAAQHVVILLWSLFHLDDFVLVVREVELGPEAEVLTDLVVIRH